MRVQLHHRAVQGQRAVDLHARLAKADSRQTPLRQRIVMMSCGVAMRLKLCPRPAQLALTASATTAASQPVSHTRAVPGVPGPCDSSSTRFTVACCATRTPRSSELAACKRDVHMEIALKVEKKWVRHPRQARCIAVHGRCSAAGFAHRWDVLHLQTWHDCLYQRPAQCRTENRNKTGWG